MWRTMYKLTKSLGDQPGPRNIADRVKGKIDKFKQHMPILHTICNPGIRERHWEAVSCFNTCPQRAAYIIWHRRMLVCGLEQGPFYKRCSQCISPWGRPLMKRTPGLHFWWIWHCKLTKEVSKNQNPLPSYMEFCHLFFWTCFIQKMIHNIHRDFSSAHELDNEI